MFASTPPCQPGPRISFAPLTVGPYLEAFEDWVRKPKAVFLGQWMDTNFLEEIIVGMLNFLWFLPKIGLKYFFVNFGSIFFGGNQKRKEFRTYFKDVCFFGFFVKKR